MASSIQEIGEAFSRHDFAEVYPHLAADVRWELIGGSPVTGRDAVIATCEESLGFLAQVTTEFGQLRSIVGADAVVVDSLAEYVTSEGDKSVVASCDIYDFVNGEVVTITSYTVEIPETSVEDQR